MTKSLPDMSIKKAELQDATKVLSENIALSLVGSLYQFTLMQTQWLKITQMYYLIAKEVKNLKWISRAVFFLQDLGDNPFPCFFQMLKSTHVPWPTVPSSVFKASSIFKLISLTLFLFPVSFLLSPLSLSPLSFSHIYICLCFYHPISYSDSEPPAFTL